MCFLTSSKKSKNSKTDDILNKAGNMKAIKLVLCGNTAVGKTSITMKYKDSTFTKIHEPTLAGSYQEKRIKDKNGE